MREIDWSKQHCGVHQGSIHETRQLMPDLNELLDSFEPETGWSPEDFIWDVKVHMLMPNQFPCIPNWHYDNVPRDVNNKQDFDKLRPDLPMFLWLSGPPLTEFRNGMTVTKIPPKTWIHFTQEDEHRGRHSTKFCWRGFIRATHKDILKNYDPDRDKLRRHCQVYLDPEKFMW
jgi:hypothetical protein